MHKIKQKIENIYSSKSKCPDITDNTLTDYGLEDISLRPYQLDGVQWLVERYHRQHGCIIADEMGLGKTCQTISLLVYLLGSGESRGPHLILSPLSVMGNWQTELKRFAPSLKTLSYKGNKEERPELRKQLKSAGDYNVVLTTYEICLKDEAFLRKFSWHTLVVDEAHRLKNRESLLHQILREFDVSHTVLVTGTPVQNNLKELYSLLSFVAPSIFKDRYMNDFVDEYDDKTKSSAVMSELHDLLKPFLLRRIKSEVVKDLPKKTEVILYHGMSAIQKKFYKAILTKDIDAFDNANKTTKTSLMNILMQLRKCVDHPYLFDGVEPEPFVLGEHLVEASGKLVLLDQLLTYLKVKGHKVLLFSQMTRMLDIVQDYLGYRGFTYERLDGSVRGEERYLAIQNFNEMDDTFIFLLSTKAGGQGLNLVSADTVIFLDSDFNPQNDLQAAARAHRIGQTRSVKVIRLVGRSTVEEIILKRALVKLKLTHSVIEGGQFSTAADKTTSITDENFQLQDILKFGVDKLFADDEGTLEDVDLDTMLGQTVAGEWQAETSSGSVTQTQSEIESMEVDPDPGPSASMYVYEGTDYSKELSAADRKAFDDLVSVEKALLEETLDEGRALRKHNSGLAGLPELPGVRKARKQFTPEELEARKLKRAETLARRAKEAEEQEIKRAKDRQLRKEKMWKANGYTSLAISLDSEGEESDADGAEPNQADQSEEDSDGGQRLDLGYLVGDVTQPQNVGDGNAIIVHCVDDSGRWGRGGLFTALASKSVHPEEGYERAGDMKDIELGDVHLIPLDDTDKRDNGLDYCALVVAQHRDKRNNLSGIKMAALNDGLQKIQKAAKNLKASVHLPRIGHNTAGFNWYGTERLIRKHLSTRGIPSYIYYYPRRQSGKRKASSETSESDVKPNHKQVKSRSRSPSPRPGTSSSPYTDHKLSESRPRHPASSCLSAQGLADFMTGICVYFHQVPQETVSLYHRHLVAYDGDMDEFMGHSTTHIVVPDNLGEDQQEDLCAVVQQYRKVPVVTESWLKGCFRKQKKLTTDSYLYG